jgi:hypothetical protein
MAAPRTITSANSKFTLIVPDAALGPFVLAGYSSDAAFIAEAREVNQNRIGVDGKISTAYVPSITNMTVTLEPNSESVGFFEAWLGAMKLAREAMIGRAQIDIPSILKSYAISHVSLSSVVEVPGNSRALDPQTFILTVGDIQVMPLIPVA